MFLLIFPLLSFASEQTANWKTFQSDYGYEFKYPECWVVEINSPDETGSLNEIRDIFLRPSETCLAVRRAEQVPNGIGFSYQGPVSRENIKSEISEQERLSKVHLANKDWIVFKKVSISGGGSSVMHIEFFDKIKKYVRWQWGFYCKSNKFSATGPMIDDPTGVLRESLLKGDSDLPEPEKTIYESIKCIKPKVKSKSKK